MLPNYSGRLLDKLFLIVAKQTDEVRENPDDPGYVSNRSTVAETVTWGLWQARERLQTRRHELAVSQLEALQKKP